MISASIVLYNTPQKQIENIINCFNPGQERLLFIVDNSNDINQYCVAISKKSKSIKYIHNKNNYGYGRAHNIALKLAYRYKAKYHVVLNPDIYFDEHVIDSLIEFADHNLDVVYILPKVVYPDGEIQYLCKLLPNPFDLIFRRFFKWSSFAKKRDEKYVLKDSGYDKIMNPPCLSGCFMFLRVSTLKEYGLLFDDRYFMYLEDFDLIRRLHRVGKTVYYPKVTIVHDHARGSYKNKKLLKCHIVSAIKYFNKFGWFFDSERKKMNKLILDEIQHF